MTTTVTISNAGPNKTRVSGGTLTSPQDLAVGVSGTYVVVDGAPVVVTELPADGGGLAGGHGEEG